MDEVDYMHGSLLCARGDTLSFTWNSSWRRGNAAKVFSILLQQLAPKIAEQMWYISTDDKTNVLFFSTMGSFLKITGKGFTLRPHFQKVIHVFNTLRTGDADLRFYITTVQDGWCKSAFLTRACFPCTVHLIMQYVEPVSEWFCWWMFIETWPHSELIFRHRVSSIKGQAFRYSPENAFYIFNQQIYFVIWYLIDCASLI